MENEQGIVWTLQMYRSYPMIWLELFILDIFGMICFYSGMPVALLPRNQVLHHSNKPNREDGKGRSN